VTRGKYLSVAGAVAVWRSVSTVQGRHWKVETVLIEDAIVTDTCSCDAAPAAVAERKCDDRDPRSFGNGCRAVLYYRRCPMTWYWGRKVAQEAYR
jgi:ribulose 1,5-bisphosphate synthetase/thiazole synthase